MRGQTIFVVLNGTPGSGKSKCLKALPALETGAVAVGYIQEVATSFLSTLSKCQLRERDPVLFQGIVASTQLYVEQIVADTLARASPNRPTIIIGDRGFWDSLAYTTADALAGLGMDIPPCEYDLCINLKSRYAGSAGNPFRTESEEEVADLEAKTEAVWRERASAFYEVGFCESIEEKVAAVASIINRHICLEAFRATPLG